jgi:Zn-dependent protease
MSGSIKIATLFGIPIVLNPSWFFIFGLLAWTFAAQVFPAERPGLAAGWYGLAGIATAVAFFVSLVLHELAHSLVAGRYGQEVRRITLFIFGGVSESADEMPSARAEFWIAVVGPLTSLALGGLLLALANVAPPGIFAAALGWLGTINLTLAVFNLLPGFPLDGGRIARAAIWAWTGDFRKATRWAGYGGQFCGLLLMATGLLRMLAGQWLAAVWVLVLGWLLMEAARSSYAQLALKEVLHRLTVADLMSTDVVTLAPQLTIAEAIEAAFTRHDYHAYPVVQDGRLLGFLDRAQVEAVPPERWGAVRVADVMHDVPALSSDLPADEALDLMAHAELQRLPVTREGGVVGVLSTSDIARRVAWARRQLGG